MTDAQEAAVPVKPPARKSKEERSSIASAAAKRRWAKARLAKKKAAMTPVKAASKKVAAKKQASGPREFSSALRAAEKRLEKAVEQRAFHATQYNFHMLEYTKVSKEIPYLQNLCTVLQNPLGSLPQWQTQLLPAQPTLEEIVSDQPLQYQNPPRITPQAPAIPVPQSLHPANTAGRAGGGAIGMELQEEEDENKFLNESGVAGGQWH